MTRIKNWRQFQHYKHRGPPWIKLHKDLLNDVDWHALDPADAKILISLWLIASEADGELPDDRKLAFRLRLPEKQISQAISRLSHWVERDASAALADRLRDAVPEKSRDRVETETETETEKSRKTGKILLPDTWMPSDHHYELGSKKGLSREAVNDAADEMRSWSLGNGMRRTNWDWVFNNWIRRNSKGNKNGQTTGNILPAIEKLRDTLADFERPGPSEIRGGTGETVVRLLSKG